MKLNMFKKLTALALVLTAGLSLAACSKDNYNTKVPYGNITGNYASYGDLKLTNKDLYTTSRVDGYNNFVEEIVKILLDKELKSLDYNNEETYEDFIDLLNTDVYGTTDKETIEAYSAKQKQTYEQKFRDGLYTAGFDLGENDLDSEATFAYYKLTLAKQKYALSQLEAIVDKEFVKDEDGKEVENTYYIGKDKLEKYYDTTYKGLADLSIVIVGFETISDLNKALAATGVDLTDDELTDDEVKNAFIKLYNNQFSYKDSLTNENFAEATTMSYENLNKYNASLVSFVKTLESGDFTKTFKEFGDKKYLIYLNNKPEEVDYNDITDEDKATYKQEIIEDFLSTSYINSEITDLINESDITIYDPILANVFSKNYDYDFSKEFDNDNVAVVNGTKISVSDYFDIVANNYGVAISLDYFSAQNIIKSKYYTSKVTSKDKEAFKKAYDKVMKDFKDNKFESSGYPKTTNRDDFRLDYFGYATESDVLKYYYGAQKAIEYLSTDKNDLYFGLLEEVGKNFVTGNYYSLDIKHVLLFVDYDMDGNMDNPTTFINKLKPSDQVEFKETIVRIYSYVKNEAEFLDCGESKALDYIVKQYTAGAALASDPSTTWAGIKGNKFNIQMKVEDLGTVDTSTATTYVKEFSDHVQSMYYDILANDKVEIDDIYVENITLDTPFEALCQTSYGFHMLVSLDGEEAPSAYFDQGDDSLDDDEYVYQDIVIEIDDEDVTIENAYSESEYASLNQLKIYVYEYMTSDGVTSLPVDVEDFINNYYSTFVTQYSNTFFKNYLVSKYIDYSKIEFTDSSNDTKLDTMINIAKKSTFAYAYEDNKLFSGWWTIVDDLVSKLD